MNRQETAMHSQKDAIKIGMVNPAIYHNTFYKGAGLANVEINRNGGINGKPIEFVHQFTDEEEKVIPTLHTMEKAIKKLFEKDKVSAVLGPMFMTNYESIGSTIGTPDTNWFFILAGMPGRFHGENLAEVLAEKLNIKTAAVLYQEKNGYSSACYFSFRDRFKELGGVIETRDIYQPGDTDFEQQLKEVKALNPEVLLLTGFAPEVPLIIKQAREMGITSRIFGGSRWVDQELFFNILEDNSPLEGCYFAAELYDLTEKAPGIQEFVKTYMHEYDMEPDRMAAVGYDTVKAFGITELKNLKPPKSGQYMMRLEKSKGMKALHLDPNIIGIWIYKRISGRFIKLSMESLFNDGKIWFETEFYPTSSTTWVSQSRYYYFIRFEI